MVKKIKKFTRVHKVHKGRPVRLPAPPGIPKAAAVHEQGGWFNFWGGDKGPTPQPKPFSFGTPTVKKAEPTYKITAVQPMVKSGGKYRQKGPTVYVTSKEGKITTLDYRPSLQDRQRLHQGGYKLTTKKPLQHSQQEISDLYGVTTYTKTGEVATAQGPRPLKQKQQQLSDAYGITTYNVDGTVSTSPVSRGELVSAGVEPDQPRSVSAEEEAPIAGLPPAGTDRNSILYGKLPDYPSHTRAGTTRIRGKKDKLAHGPFAAGDPNSLLRKIFGWGTR